MPQRLIIKEKMMAELCGAFSGLWSLPVEASVAWGFAGSFLICVLLVLTQRWHGTFSTDSTSGIQKFHIAPTPRIGGVPVVLGLVAAWAVAPQDIQAILTPLLLAGLPAFLFGLAEDITKRVGVAERLFATMASGVLAWWLTGYSVTRADVVGLDALLQVTLISVAFTAFAVGGVANSINIIDGFNGLASTTSTLAFLGYALMSYQLGDSTLAGLALILAACVWGFFWVNWPFGKLFLGDGGAYFIGYALAWVAVMLIERNPQVSVFAVLTICVHPVTEVLFSVYRRRVRAAHPGMPDRLHFHSLLKRRYVSRWFSCYPVAVRNSITGLIVGMMTLTAVLLANLTFDSQGKSVVALLLLLVGYVVLYLRMARHRWFW